MDENRDPSNMHVGVEDARDHMDGQEDHGQDRDAAVDLLLSKAGQLRARARLVVASRGPWSASRGSGDDPVARVVYHR